MCKPILENLVLIFDKLRVLTIHDLGYQSFDNSKNKQENYIFRNIKKITRKNIREGFGLRRPSNVAIKFRPSNLGKLSNNQVLGKFQLCSNFS